MKTSTMLALQTAAAVQAAVLAVEPQKGETHVKLAKAPLALSFEFASVDKWFNIHGDASDASAGLMSQSCISTISYNDFHIRIGGRTQDLAKYKEGMKTGMKHHGSEKSKITGEELPHTRFGPAFLDALPYGSQITLGLNRARNDLHNPRKAALELGVKASRKLYAFEFGNEPDMKHFNPQENPKSEREAHEEVLKEINERIDEHKDWTPGFSIFQSGSFSQNAPAEWNAASVLDNPANKSSVKTYSRHFYAQQDDRADLRSLMSHANTVAALEPLLADAAEARKRGVEPVLGETNSVGRNGTVGVSDTFGAAIWTLDHALYSLSGGFSRVFFHMNTAGKWWSKDKIYSPMYGALAAVTALKREQFIKRMDMSKFPGLSGYSLWSSPEKVNKVVLINTNFYDGHGSRQQRVVPVVGFKENSSLYVTRLTAASALSKEHEGSYASFGGQHLAHNGCYLSGTLVAKRVTVVNGSASVEVGASEAVIVSTLSL